MHTCSSQPGNFRVSTTPDSARLIRSREFHKKESSGNVRHGHGIALPALRRRWSQTTQATKTEATQRLVRRPNKRSKLQHQINTSDKHQTLLYRSPACLPCLPVFIIRHRAKTKRYAVSVNSKVQHQQNLREAPAVPSPPAARLARPLCYFPRLVTLSPSPFHLPLHAPASYRMGVLRWPPVSASLFLLLRARLPVPPIRTALGVRRRQFRQHAARGQFTARACRYRLWLLMVSLLAMTFVVLLDFVSGLISRNLAVLFVHKHICTRILYTHARVTGEKAQ